MMGILLILIAGVITSIGFWISCENEFEREKMREEISPKLEELEIVKENIKSYVSFLDQDGCLIYTKKDKLFLIKNKVGDYKNIHIQEICLDDILEVKVDVHIKERNSMKIISIVPTFDKHTIVLKANMIITTLDEVINLTISKSSLFDIEKILIKDDRYDFNWENKLNELNRLKLLINRKISKEV
ncbi:hypothetical protein GCM10008904_07250 [Paraclostridium ghonii]|uniref:Uncharacterized protein n=1 Tax=Paraclostridium ghonii TaxID=29358 RepID=A0ABU0N2V8_9FIRM|nr:hypothetical protein [Paeniclostridium ghonii]MDQ0557460.1 hypothetical protein [Paeniclostridium ghonii]